MNARNDSTKKWNIKIRGVLKDCIVIVFRAIMFFNKAVYKKKSALIEAEKYET